ncbi:MAG: thiamine phosphate synthase [Candidatus Korobacteraceae bacterium]
MMLYYITDRNAFGGTESERHVALLRRIAEAACAGIEFIQLREKDLSFAELELLAREALHVIRDSSANTKLLINTHADIARAVGADGVHLTADSPPAREVRAAWLGHTWQHPLIAVSVHDVAEVRASESQGADFVVLAPIFEKAPTRVNGIGLTALRMACAASQIPVLALGGVNLTNALSCLDARAAGVAGIRLFQQGEIVETVMKLRELPSSR